MDNFDLGLDEKDLPATGFKENGEGAKVAKKETGKDRDMQLDGSAKDKDKGSQDDFKSMAEYVKEQAKNRKG